MFNSSAGLLHSNSGCWCLYGDSDQPKLEI
jgi:hypothetical protein